MLVLVASVVVVAVLALAGVLFFVMRSRMSRTSICILSEGPFAPIDLLREALVRDVFPGEARVVASTVEFEGYAIEFSEIVPPPRADLPWTIYLSGFAAKGVTDDRTKKMGEALAKTAGWFLKQPTVRGMLRTEAGRKDLFRTSPELMARLDSGHLDELPGLVPEGGEVT